MTEICNLTPHAVNLVGDDGNVIRTYEPIGLARAEQRSVVCGTLDGIELVKTVFGKVEGLPDYQEGVFYIVSAITINAAKAEGRTTADLLVVSDTVRNDQGQIIGCKRFAVI